jgi:hypothetical protein
MRRLRSVEMKAGYCESCIVVDTVYTEVWSLQMCNVM